MRGIEVARIEIRIGGLGGQGVITAGYVLGQAACLFDQKNATQTQSYGPEARGSACRSGRPAVDRMHRDGKTSRNSSDNELVFLLADLDAEAPEALLHRLGVITPQPPRQPAGAGGEGSANQRAVREALGAGHTDCDVGRRNRLHCEFVHGRARLAHGLTHRNVS